MTSRFFNQNLRAAKRAAKDGPVVVTDHGRPSHVLMSYDDYCNLTEPRRCIVDLIADTRPEADFEFEPERSKEPPRTVDFD